MNIPKVFTKYEITENNLLEICIDVANNATPISSGKGEAIINPANIGIKYLLNK